jgi:hypothetical protein
MTDDRETRVALPKSVLRVKNQNTARTGRRDDGANRTIPVANAVRAISFSPMHLREALTLVRLVEPDFRELRAACPPLRNNPFSQV